MTKPLVGMLTYHRAINYGAVLQCYALFNYIRQASCEVKVLDYSSEAVLDQYRRKSLKKCKSVKGYIGHNLTVFLRRKKKKQFSNFLSKIELSEKMDSNTIQAANDTFDTFVVGSDQVFNPICQGDDINYLLGFANDNKKKNGYSVSFGSLKNMELSSLDYYKEVSSFNNISFRENDAAEHFSNRLKHNYLTTIDPVFLLTKEEWEKVALNDFNKKYIFVYNLMNLDEIFKFAKKLSKETKLPIVIVNRSIKGDRKSLFRFKNKSNIGPDSFLGYIKNAEYVVTDSFHGVSFSYIFQKQFFVVLNSSKNNTNSRILNVLTKMNLLSRVVDGDLSIKKDNIDYENLSNTISNDILISKNYLNLICKGDGSSSK